MTAPRIDEQSIVTCVQNYRKEAKDAKKSRMDQNAINFECYNLRQDFSGKIKGQSTEFLPKQAMAVEQAANFIQQGLTDIGEWFRTEPEEGLNEDLMKVKPSTVYKILSRQLAKTGFMVKIGDAAKLGLLGSLMIAKVGGRWVSKPIFKVEGSMKNGSYTKRLVKKEDRVWELDISLLRQEDYYPDPTGKGLYELQDIWMDFHEVEKLSKGKNAIYDPKVVKDLEGGNANEAVDDQAARARETGQDSTNHGHRKQIKLTECWGTLLDEDGCVTHENIVCTIANDRFVIQKPIENPYWHGESPFVADAIISVPHSVWGRAMMDAPSMLNRAINDMFNLQLDGGMMAVHGIKELNKHWLEDPSQVDDGIPAGTTLLRNQQAPPGIPVLASVGTSTVPPDAMQVGNMLNQEFNVAAMTNDLRMGVASFRSVKATEVVEASQTITSMFSGIAKNIEGEDKSGFITPILRKSWMVCAQHVNDFNQADLKALLGDKVTAELLAMGNEDLFAETVNGCRFRTFGISAMLNKQKDFTKLTALLQTVSGSEVLTEAFLQKYDFSKYLTEIMRSLNINPFKLEADKSSGGDLSQQPPQPAQQGMPDAQSQIPQAGAAGNQADLNPAAQAAQPVQGPQFPASRATPKG